MIYCKELAKEFANKSEMFAALKADKDKIIGLKKAATKNSDPVQLHIKPDAANKADTQPDSVGIGSTIYAVINTTNYLDSHGDVHIDGIWDVSVKDSKGKLFYAVEHNLSIGQIVSYPDDVEASVLGLNWSQLGLNFTGKTQALMFAAKLTDITNGDYLKLVSAKKPIQNSVCMQYIAITLCIDDPSEDFAQEYANFYKYLAVIANKQDAIDAGYFWAVTEAKIFKEGSAVLFGSNSATPVLYTDPASTSQKEEVNPASTSLPTPKVINYDFLTNLTLG